MFPFPLTSVGKLRAFVCSGAASRRRVHSLAMTVANVILLAIVVNPSQSMLKLGRLSVRQRYYLASLRHAAPHGLVDADRLDPLFWCINVCRCHRWQHERKKARPTAATANRAIANKLG